MRRSNRRVAIGTQEGPQRSAKFMRILALRYTHMAAMLFSMMADVKMIHLPYQKVIPLYWTCLPKEEP
jgi:hypothetical protein